MELVTFIKEFGAAGIDLFWTPVLIWTILAAAAIVVFRSFPQISPAYQYHGRVSIAWALPLGILVSVLFNHFSAFAESTAAMPVKFIVIQNPINITASPAEQAFNWLEPSFLLGTATMLCATIVLFGLIKLGINLASLQSFSRKIGRSEADINSLLSEKNRLLLYKNCQNTSIVFSKNIDVPCTFGLRKKWVVLPETLRNEREKLNIAVRHELMHICQYDYLLNTTLQGIKALFYFHPLVHLLVNEAGDQRELYCDQNVLTDPEISEKRYAELLFELAPQKVFRATAAVSMAVNPSTLKKRIQIMKTPTSAPSIKRSITLMLITGLLFTGIMACSDMEENGITSSEVQEIQSKMNKPSPASPALEDNLLFVINGERIEDEKSKGILSRIKPKYIESIQVWKGEKATEMYGSAGQNGVIEIKLIDKEKAYSDLRPNTPPPPSKKSGQNDFYVAVERMPQLKGGINALMQNVNYPENCKKAGIEGRVTVSFIVDKQGNVENPNVIRGIGGGCDEEALRVVKQAEFEPGTQDGKPVRVQMSLPVLFKTSSAFNINFE